MIDANLCFIVYEAVRKVASILYRMIAIGYISTR
uniref:Uncharacterized protein n=1 Tax=Arundo donax TaxID=35708 RepID=A0A0A9C1J4_ARUDO